MSFPRIELISELVGDEANYVDGIRWRVFKDIDGDLPGTNVLVIAGNNWTIVTADDFRRMAERILPQLG